jgi:maltose alpha-D-glucosyltransferase/alpha-amylase
MTARRRARAPLEPNPLWYKDAVIYELHVRAFFDSNGDGVGDFRGLAEKLDYVQDLGVTAIWVLPFYPSPLKDDGYDIADYTDVHPAYGTLADFRAFVREAHRRGLRVITELVCNHTSDQHPWFQRARRSPGGSRWRDFYVWSATAEQYRDARIIFKDFETSNWTWDPTAAAYFWHRFYSHQPDLNFDHPPVRRAVLRVLEFWMAMGIDGVRLDAVPYLYEREGTTCENLPETHAFLRQLRRHVDARFSGRMLLAEANQWPEDAAAYFGGGDECHMAFHFPLMPRMFMAIRMEDSFPVIDILQQTPAIPDSCQWALFLRNHDELTLEMVTDEDRDYMYRVYASDPEMRINLGIRRRLAPLLGNHRRRIELMNALLFSLPGTPVIYYGDEIGMGDNVFLGDRNSVRAPMQWSADRNAGFSRANRQRLYLPAIVDPEYHYEAVNVEAQQANPHSLLWWMKRLIALRKRSAAFRRGTLQLLRPENSKVLAFIRAYGEQRILVVANLSRFSQGVELDLSAFRGMRPVELFGRVEFPRIGELPYFITLGPHGFFWFSLEPAPEPVHLPAPAARVPALTVRGPWTDLLSGTARDALSEVLPEYLERARWFGGKARRIKGTQIVDTMMLDEDFPGTVALVQVDYREGDPETYVLPLTVAHGAPAARIRQESPSAIIADMHSSDGDGILYDASAERGFARALLHAIGARHRGREGRLIASATSALGHLPEHDGLEPSVLRAEQSNTSIIYGTRFILKLFRRLEPGTNPDLEIGRYLTARNFPHVPPVAGAIEVRSRGGEPATLAILQGFIPNAGDAWRYTLDALGHYFERAAAVPAHEAAEVMGPRRPVLDLAEDDPTPRAQELTGGYLESARLLGRRTAELHSALADGRHPEFAPEASSAQFQRSMYESMRTLTLRTLDLLRRRNVPAAEAEPARAVLAAQEEILRRMRAVLDRRITAMRTRAHGDYHLGQVLYTGRDFVIIDFEGEPMRPLTERRLKRLALRDVAGMLRSFHYAAFVALDRTPAARTDNPAGFETWAETWYRWAASAFLRGYMQAAAGAAYMPRGRDELRLLLDALVLEKAVYELGYELNNRPAWAGVPLRGILQLLAA